jgi:hypothetical protein
MVKISSLLAAAILALAWNSNAMAERRVALVVGNSNYQVASISLSNPKNDARDVATALQGLGFEVDTAIDANKRNLDLALARFARAATDSDSAVFYYAGHALQFRGVNYVMPTDAKLEDEISLRYEMVSVEDIRAALDRTNGVQIMILDACRNNPLADRLKNSTAGAARSIGEVRGLARIDKAQGMVIAYATAADQVAQDGRGRNSPFTSALLKRMQEPGLEIEMMLRRVSKDVADETGGRQRPETYISLQSEYYLNQTDRVAWDIIKDQDNRNLLRDFISKYQSSPYALEARSRLDDLERNARGEVLARRDDAGRRAKATGTDHLRAEEERKRPADPLNNRLPAQPEAEQRPTQQEAAVRQPTAPQQQAALGRPAPAQPAAPEGSLIRYSVPIPFGPPPVNGQSIEKLITGEPEFPPIDGLDEKLWKHPCGTCHKWDPRTLCEQGNTYVKNPASIFRHQHPFDAFKVAIMEWAKTGCLP